MIPFIAVGVLLGSLLAGLLALASPVSEWLVRARARRLPPALASRMEEEWLAELNALCSRPSQLAFAIALTLTRRHSFAIEQDNLLDSSSRPLISVAAVGGWPSVVLASTLMFAAIAYGASFLITPMYRSTARIQVVPSRVPEALVQTPARLPWQERLKPITEQVMSPDTLGRVALEFHLHAETPQPGAPAVVSAGAVEQVRRGVEFRLLPDGQSFEVGYQSPDPQVARKVAMRLASLYLQDAISDQANTSEGPIKLLDEQSAEIRSRMLAQTVAMQPAAGPHALDAETKRLEHEQLKSAYRALLLKREEALLAANLERRQIGETFKLLETATLPNAPISPNRLLIATEGAVVGCLLGFALMLAGRLGARRWLGKAVARS